MKPTDVFVDHWTAKSLEAGSDYPAHLQFVRRLIATVTEEHCKAIERAGTLGPAHMELATHAIREWNRGEGEECTNS